MKTRVLSLILVAVAFASPSWGASKEADPVVIMPPYRVDDFSTYLGFAWNAVLKEEKIATVRFSRVERQSLAARAGLMENDYLYAIDGHAVAGLTVKELQQLFGRNWKPGDTLKWEFTVERGGLFNRRHTITLQMKTKAVDAEASTKNDAK